MSSREWELSALDVAVFMGHDRRTRELIIRMLGEPIEEDWIELELHPQGPEIARWLLTLPAYAYAGQDA